MKIFWAGTSPASRSLPFVFALFFFAGLGLLGFPRPMMDDLFFIGAGLNLASGGDFSNPLLARQGFPGSLYFVHPPLHSYALAGWLKIFGISTGSLLAFQMVMYVLVCWAAIWILRKYRGPRLFEWLLPLGVATAFLSVGLRPEPLSAMLTMVGYAFLLCLGGEGLVLFCGFFLIFLGASAASRLSFFSAALALSAFIQLHRGGLPLIRLAVPAGSALLTALFTFACLIGFRFREFFAIYHFHAAGRIGGAVLWLLGHFLLGTLAVTQWPLILLWLATLPLLWRLRSQAGDLTRPGLFVASLVFILAAIGWLGHGVLWYVIFSLFALTTAYVQQSSSRRAWLPQVVLAIALLIANSKNCLEIIGLAAGRVTAETDSPAIPQLSPEHPMLIDPSSARYAFNYRLPKGVIDWNFSAPFPKELATDSALHPDDIFVVGASAIEVLNRNKLLDESLPKWNPLGWDRWSFYQHPQRIYVIYAKDCLKHETQN